MDYIVFLLCDRCGTFVSTFPTRQDVVGNRARYLQDIIIRVDGFRSFWVRGGAGLYSKLCMMTLHYLWQPNVVSITSFSSMDPKRRTTIIPLRCMANVIVCAPYSRKTGVTLHLESLAPRKTDSRVRMSLGVYHDVLVQTFL